MTFNRTSNGNFNLCRKPITQKMETFEFLEELHC